MPSDKLNRRIILLSEPLWEYVEQQAPHALRQPHVQPLTLLDLDDLELLLGIVEGGVSVVDILRRRTESPYRKVDVQHWRANDPTAPPEQVPSPLS